MAWASIEVHKDEVIFLSHVKLDVVDKNQMAGTFCIPCSSGLEVGDTFKADDVLFQVDALEDLNDRGEVFLIYAMEVKNDKPKTRRNAARARKSNLPSESNDGHNNAD